MKKESKEKINSKGRISKVLKDHFIPHEDNDHKPLVIRHSALKCYGIILILIKVFVTGFLFLSYPSLGYFTDVTSDSIINLTNSSRQENNLPGLQPSETLNLAAYQKAQDMVKNNYFSHESPSGAHFWNWILGAGYQYLTAGENLAMDFTSAETVHRALMASGSHRKNILNPNFTNIGVSVISGKINHKDTMVLVQMFGAPKVEATTPETKEEVKKETAPTPLPKEGAVQPEPYLSPPPFFQAEVTEIMADSLNIQPGEKITFWIDIKNTGNTPWLSSGDNFIALNVTDPAGRESHFKHSSWPENYRPAQLIKERVLPSETARFEFALQAPQEPGEYNEAFQLVAENLTWIEGSHFVVPIAVSKPVIKNTNTKITTEVNQNQNLNTNRSQEINIITLTNTDKLIGEVIQEPTTPLVEGQTIKKPRGFADYLITYSRKIFWFILIFISIALLINIFVKIRIQHLNIIIPTLFVILLAGLMLFSHFHFLENIISQPTVL